MKTIDRGHWYSMDTLDSIDEVSYIKFVKRTGSNYPGNQPPDYSGINCQEVLRVLIDRCKYLNNQFPCAETEAIIGNLSTALLLFELRAARQHNRHLSIKNLDELVESIPCSKCGHLQCLGNHNHT